MLQKRLMKLFAAAKIAENEKQIVFTSTLNYLLFRVSFVKFIIAGVHLSAAVLFRVLDKWATLFFLKKWRLFNSKSFWSFTWNSGHKKVIQIYWIYGPSLPRNELEYKEGWIRLPFIRFLLLIEAALIKTGAFMRLVLILLLPKH